MRGIRMQIRTQLKQIIDAKKNDIEYPSLNDGALNDTNFEVFAHSDMNYVRKSALYIGFGQKRESRKDEYVYYAFDLIYYEQIQKLQDWCDVVDQRADDLDRLLNSYIPPAAFFIENFDEDRFRIKLGKGNKREFICSAFQITYACIRNTSDRFFNN